MSEPDRDQLELKQYLRICCEPNAGQDSEEGRRRLQTLARRSPRAYCALEMAKDALRNFRKDASHLGPTASACLALIQALDEPELALVRSKVVLSEENGKQATERCWSTRR